MPRANFSPNKNDPELIRRFVASFERLGDVSCPPDEPPPDELSAGTDADGWHRWRPAEIPSVRDQLESLYQRLPGRFPALYEELVLTYRWLEIDLQTVRLLANPPGPTLSGLTQEIFRDPAIVDVLIPAGFVPFARAPDLNYNPVCFDLNSVKGGDCPIIQFEHEAILCHGRIGQSWRQTASFRTLMEETINLAQSSEP